MSTETTAFGYTANLPVEKPEAIIERTVSVDDPGAHDLLVRVHAVSVNPVDVKLRASAPADGAPEGFRVLGFDASGVVEKVGDSVTLFAPGDEVYYAGNYARPGTNQLRHLVDERIVGHRPQSLTHADCASLPLTALTAWGCVFDRLAITAETEGSLLVVGATGGVGSILIQLVAAKAPHVRIIATASNPESRNWVRELGAHDTVNHHLDLVEELAAVAPGGVDWVFTAHSEGQLETYAKVLRAYGEIVAIDDGPRDVAVLKDKSIAWHWEFMFTDPIEVPESTHQHEILEHLAVLVTDGFVRATTSTVLSPITAQTIREGHRLVESGRTLGKVVIAQEGG
jgi:NADPH:quinone reductase